MKKSRFASPRNAIRSASTALNALLSEKKPSKYKNTRCEYMGEKFDSKKELTRHLVLLDMQKRGEITGLIRQPQFGLEVMGKLICVYRGDWRYFENAKGDHPANAVKRQEVVEDAKGYRTPEFKLKWKLCKALYPDIDWRTS